MPLNFNFNQLQRLIFPISLKKKYWRYLGTKQLKSKVQEFPKGIQKEAHTKMKRSNAIPVRNINGSLALMTVPKTKSDS